MIHWNPPDNQRTNPLTRSIASCCASTPSVAPNAGVCYLALPGTHGSGKVPFQLVSNSLAGRSGSHA